MNKSTRAYGSLDDKDSVESCNSYRSSSTRVGFIHCYTELRRNADKMLNLVKVVKLFTEVVESPTQWSVICSPMNKLHLRSNGQSARISRFTVKERGLGGQVNSGRLMTNRRTN